jgi:hypothetical protein
MAPRTLSRKNPEFKRNLTFSGPVDADRIHQHKGSILPSRPLSNK